MTELDIQENGIEDISGSWLSCFPESFTSLEVLNFANVNSEVDFDALEKLVSRCKSLKDLKVNKSISLEQLQKLLVLAPQLVDLGTGSFSQELTDDQRAELESAFNKCKNIHKLSGLWQATALYFPALSPVCANLTFLNLSYATLGSSELVKLLMHCPLLKRLWVRTAGIFSFHIISTLLVDFKFSMFNLMIILSTLKQVLDTVEDRGLEAVGSSCPLLEELRVFPADPFDEEITYGVTEAGFLAVSHGCPRLQYVLYFCQAMTNAAVATIVRNCPNFTCFRLCIMNPGQPDYVTNEPMDEAFGAVVKTCTNLQRLSLSGFLTDLTFEYIGQYAKNLELLSVAFAGSSDWGMQCVLRGCPKLRKFEIRDCPFGDAALLSGLDKYESMRSLWMSACNVTMDGCKLLASKKPRLNVEVIKEAESDDNQADKVYVYRTVAGPRKDAPPSVITL